MKIDRETLDMVFQKTTCDIDGYRYVLWLTFSGYVVKRCEIKKLTGSGRRRAKWEAVATYVPGGEWILK